MISYCRGGGEGGATVCDHHTQLCEKVDGGMVGGTTILGTNIIHGANSQTTDFVQCRITAHNQRSNLFRFCRMSEEYNYTTAYYDYLTYLLHTGEIHSFLFLIINGIPFPQLNSCNLSCIPTYYT